MNPLDKFFKDPEWYLVEEKLLKHIEPLYDVTNIDTNKTNEEIAAEVRGRQLTISTLTAFLRESNILQGRGPSKPSFR